VKITDRSFTSVSESDDTEPILTKVRTTTPLLRDIDLSSLESNPLWNILIDTARRNPMYAGLSGYIRDKILPNEPEVTPRELASRLSISLGEALVILADIHKV
jgi:hypothetical protein